MLNFSTVFALLSINIRSFIWLF